MVCGMILGAKPGCPLSPLCFVCILLYRSVIEGRRLCLKAGCSIPLLGQFFLQEGRKSCWWLRPCVGCGAAQGSPEVASEYTSSPVLNTPGPALLSASFWWSRRALGSKKSVPNRSVLQPWHR